MGDVASGDLGADGGARGDLVGRIGELAPEDDGLPKRERRAFFWSLGRAGSCESGAGTAVGGACEGVGFLKRFNKPCECTPGPEAGA